MSSTIQNLIKEALGDGARNAKFEVQVQMPLSSMYPEEKSMSVIAKTSSFPAKQHEMIPIKYKGRAVPTKGQVKYVQSWECTFYLSEDHSLKLAFEQWIEALDQKHNYDDTSVLGVTELQKFFSTSETNYTMPILISQLNFDMDKAATTYELQNCFPVQVGPIEVSSEGVGSIMEFTVTFAMSHFLVNAAHKSTTPEKWTEDLSAMSKSAKSGTVASAQPSKVTSSVTGASAFSLSNMAQSMVGGGGSW